MTNPGPEGFVQGGQITSMLDDVTSILLIFESKGQIYPSSTNLHTIFIALLVLESMCVEPV